MKCFVFIAALCMSLQPAYAQLFSLEETDPNGRVYSVSTRQPVDINSQIAIRINQDAIENFVNTTMITDSNMTAAELINALRTYKEFIINLEATTKAYAALFDPPQASIDLDELQTALEDRATVALEVLATFPEDSRFGVSLEEGLGELDGQSTTAQFLLMIRLLAEEVDLVEKDLAALRNDAGYRFQLAAWINTKQGLDSLHLPGFDDIAQGEFFEFQRNQFTLTAAQLQELEQLNNFFESVEASDVLDNVIDMLPDLAFSLVDINAIASEFDTLKSLAETLTTSAVAEKNKLLAAVNEVGITWTAIRSKLTAIKRGNFQQAGDSKLTVIKSFMDDVSAVGAAVRQLESDIAGIAHAVNFELLGNQAGAVKTQFTTLANTIKNQADQLIQHASNAYHVAVYGREINAAALEITEQVLELAIDKIPAGTTLDLLYSGRREPGDVIAVKAVIKKTGQAVPLHEEIIQFPVMNALPHVHMSVVYAFAKPNEANVNWKGGPLVSLLYKFKSRSMAYRNFLDPGIGLHAASYDFNNDDTPEFAGGMVVSMFRDYLQGGWGFNFNANSGYWFAGLRIPIPTSPLALSGSQ